MVVVKVTPDLVDVAFKQPTSSSADLNQRVKEIEYVFSFGLNETEILSSLNCGVERGTEKVVRGIPNYGVDGNLREIVKQTYVVKYYD